VSLKDSIFKKPVEPCPSIIKFDLTVYGKDADAIKDFKSMYEYFGKKMEEARQLSKEIETLKRKVEVYREIAAVKVFDDLQNSEFDVKNQKQSDVLMKECKAIVDAEAERRIGK